MGWFAGPNSNITASRALSNSNILFPWTLWSLLLCQNFSIDVTRLIPRMTDHFSIFAILSQICSSQLLTSYFAMHIFNVTFSCTPLCSYRVSSVTFWGYRFLCLSYRLCACGTSMPPLPRHLPWFGHPSYIWWSVQIMHVSPVSCSVVPLSVL